MIPSDGTLVVVIRSLASFLAVIGVLVLVHELGHYLAARMVGVRVSVFSVGFGRALWSRRSRGGTLWRLAAIPLGGYVRVEGMQPGGVSSGFAGRGAGTRAFVYAAGPAANLLFAWFAFMVVVASIGSPPRSLVVSSVTAGAPAVVAGIVPGDVVVAIDGVAVSRIPDLQDAIGRSGGSSVALSVDRAGAPLAFSLRPSALNGRFVVGLAFEAGLRPVPLGAVPEAAFRWSLDFTVETLRGLWSVVTGSVASDAVGGPIKIAQVSGQAASLGFGRLVLLVAFLSINLGIVNLVPIPFLDGGHIVFCAVEAVIGRPVSSRILAVGNSIGLALIVGVMTFATLNDIINLPSFRQLVGG